MVAVSNLVATILILSSSIERRDRPRPAPLYVVRLRESMGRNSAAMT